MRRTSGRRPDELHGLHELVALHAAFDMLELLAERAELARSLAADLDRDGAGRSAVQGVVGIHGEGQELTQQEFSLLLGTRNLGHS